ncbi:hypothetical protein KP509_26G057900 [Ceratopteris richardii]|nr:hypothetical protein KP509_26G057900 [Ceratopteris richardii]
MYSEMKRGGSLHPNTDTYVALLQGCTMLKDIGNGTEIHSRLGELETDLFVGSTLISMYGKCGLLDKAHEVFVRIQKQNVVAWTALIAGYAEHGHGEIALKLYKKMQEAGICPNAITFVCILKACGALRATCSGQMIHAEVESKGLMQTNLFIGSAVVDMYAKFRLLEKAQDVFNKLSLRNSVSWNALISGYSNIRQDQRVLECFHRMCFESVFPDGITFACALKACGNLNDINTGHNIHTEIGERDPVKKQAFVCNALINMYAKSGSLLKAQQVFNSLPARDVVSWTALISGYAEHEHGEEALECFEQLKVKGLVPNAVTYICSLKACGAIGAVEKGEEIHTEIERRGLLEEGLVGSTLVDMYARCGSLTKAQQVLDTLSLRNVVSWTSLMAGYALIGKGEPVFANFSRMLSEGIQPNFITFVVLLNACTVSGLLNKSQTYFQAISKDFGIIPLLEHWTCMVNLLGCLGESINVENMVDKLSVIPDMVLWCSVLGACKNWGSLRFAEQVFENIGIN